MSRDGFVGLATVEPLFLYTAFADKETEQSIPERFEEVVRLCGERLAVRSEKALFSYDHLNRTANRWAHKILSVRGSGVEAVALLLEHDAGVLAAMMGVLKSGKFYVVLDPGYPKDRLT